MSDRPTIFITGATDGLGRALANRLAAGGASLILHGRDPGRLDQTAHAIRDAHDVERLRTVLADLADLAQVRRLAADVRQATDRLDVFISNAGVGSGEPDGRTRRTSVDGYELRFAVNYLAGFLLTLELLPLLRASAPARIVNVASIGQHPLDFADLMLEHGYSGTRAYGQSKLAQIMSGFELAGRIAATEVHREQPAPVDLHANQDGAAGGRAHRGQPGRRGRRHRAAGRQPGTGHHHRQVL